MKTNRIALIIISLIILTSCVFSRTVLLSSKSYAPITPEDVTIFLDEKDLPKDYEKVALITTDYTSSWDKAKWKSVKKKCAEIGCNGVFQKLEKRASTGEKIAAAVFGYGSSDKAEFVAIRYKK